VEDSQASHPAEHAVITVTKADLEKRKQPKKAAAGVFDTVNTDNLTDTCLKGWVWR